MNKVFVSSDHHFGHGNIIKYCNRPFEDVRQMNEHMASEWNRRVRDCDTVYYLGDFSFGRWEWTRDILNMLNGTIYLVPGNHDEEDHKGHVQPWHEEFGTVLDRLVRLEHNGQKYTLCHYPIESWHKGDIHLCGHRHGAGLRRENRYDVGVDVYGGPVELSLNALENPVGWSNQGVDRIFVFGSNEAGRHGAGAAKYAAEHRGAVMGEGVGHHGNSYAIPTKDFSIKTLPLPKVEEYVNGFIAYANLYPELRFDVTRIGCGLAGFTDEQIAPLFEHAPKNCDLPKWWDVILERNYE